MYRTDVDERRGAGAQMQTLFIHRLDDEEQEVERHHMLSHACVSQHMIVGSARGSLCVRFAVRL